MPEKLLPENIVVQIKEAFNGLKHPVELLLFGAKENCEYCNDTRQLLEEVSAIRADMVGLSVYDLHADADIARQYKMDKAPGIVIAGRDGDQLIDYSVQYSGIPSGHEFGTLINAIMLVSGRDSGLSQQTRDYVKKLEKPAHLQVFVTPT
jgi:alkyl hydroperoxide reductase subunit AhpF